MSRSSNHVTRLDRIEFGSTGSTLGTNPSQQRSKPEGDQIPYFRFQASNSKLQPPVASLSDFRLKTSDSSFNKEHRSWRQWPLVSSTDSTKNTLLERQEWNHVNYSLGLQDFRLRTLKQLSESILQIPDLTLQTSHLQFQIPDSTLQNPACRFEIQDFRFQGSGPRF